MPLLQLFRVKSQLLRVSTPRFWILESGFWWHFTRTKLLSRFTQLHAASRDSRACRCRRRHRRRRRRPCACSNLWKSSKSLQQSLSFLVTGRVSREKRTRIDRLAQGRALLVIIILALKGNTWRLIPRPSRSAVCRWQHLARAGRKLLLRNAFRPFS